MNIDGTGAKLMLCVEARGEGELEKGGMEYEYTRSRKTLSLTLQRSFISIPSQPSF